VDGAIGNTWQIGSTLNRSLLASMKAIICSVELRREESRGALEDLIGPTQLAVLPLQGLQPLALVGALDAGRRGRGVTCAATWPPRQ
jgi:hypothetical protein